MTMNESDGKELVIWPTAGPSAGKVPVEKTLLAAMREAHFGSEAKKSLSDYLAVVIEQKRLVVIIFLACTITASIYAMIASPVYTSSALIEIEERRPQLKEKMIASQDYVEITRYLETQTEILRSRDLAESLVRKMALVESPEFKPRARSGVLGWLFSFLTKNESESGTREDSVVSSVMDRVKVDPVKKSNLIRVTMEAGNPVDAQHMLQNYLSLYLEQNLEKRRQEGLAGAQWLGTEAEKAEKKLREAQSALVRFVIDEGIVDSADGGIGQALNLVNKTMQTHLKSQEQREKLETLKNQQSSQATVLSDEMKSQLIDKLKEELAAAESDYSQMKGVYSATYPKMRLTMQRMDFLRRRIAELEQKMVSTALDVAKAREALSKKAYERSKTEADRVKAMEARYFLLKGTVDTAGEFLKILLREYKATEIKARTISNNASLADHPSLPRRPSRPHRVLVVLLGAVLGLCGGLLAAFTRDLLDQTVRRPGDAKLFQTRNLGIVPDLKKFPSVEGRFPTNLPVELIAYQYPQSVVSDAIKNIETSIFLSTLDRAFASLAVVAATPGEGKSLFAVSLASVLAGASEKRVVLVDADLRKPRIHEVFFLDAGGPGLTDLLRDPGTSLDEVIIQTAVDGLFVVPSGTRTADPIALLRGSHMRQLMGQLKEQFDYVVIDTPPILGLADTPLICRHVDRAVLVVMQGRVLREEVSLALDTINWVDTNKILGMILNKVNGGATSVFAHGFGRHYFRNYKYYHKTS